MRACIPLSRFTSVRTADRLRKERATMKENFKLTTLEKSWILYDVGNSAFTLLVSPLLPIYFNSLATSAGVSETNYLAYWGYAGSIATLIVAIIAPICGTMSDQRGMKKPIFLLCMGVGVLCCAALGLAWSWIAFLVIFVIAKIGYTAANVFYDAMLPEIAGGNRMDRISSQGYALGYIGSVIPFVVCLVLVLFAESFGMTMGTAMVIAFLITAGWWAVCTLPLMRHYHQSAYVERMGHPVRETFRQLGRTFREIRKEKHIFLYLLSFFFFIDGVYTIIDMATAYGTALGLDTTGLLLALLLTQFVAFPCAIIFGRLASRHDTGKLIKICILAYTFINVFAVFLVAQWQFWMLAVMVGMFQGGIQALARSYLGKIIPAERSGEFYGFMDICGKGASFFGTMLIAVVSQLTDGMEIHIFGLIVQNESIAVGALVFTFIIGFILFCKADKMNKERVAN